MELIIKPTGLCNFACSFCSSATLPILEKPLKKVPDKLKDLIDYVKPDELIVTGGDPLMVDPEYYYHLHDIRPVHISITSNLKDFYIHPDKWIKLFKEDWFDITISFQYGEGRKWDINTIYTEEMFRDVHNKFTESIGKDLPFISVIDYNNEHTVLDLYKLAKSLNTKVKINNMLALGYSDLTYPRYKMFQHYINIIESGLGDYEAYCSKPYFHGCPFNKNFTCESMIRACYIDNKGELHYFHCDNMDGEYEVQLDYKSDKIGLISTYPKLSEHVNSNCWQCELFELCNGCKSARMTYPKEHCEEMLKLKDKIIEYEWVDKKGLI